MKPYEVQTYTLCDGWVNTWSDDQENPVTFATREEAEQALGDYLDDLTQAVTQGDIEDYAIQDFRVVEI